MKHRDPKLVAASAVVAAACWSCGGDAPPETQPICDGSDEARLVYTAGGGELTFEDEFTARYGRRYLVIDGHCGYWLGRNTLQGVGVGTIAAERAERLSSELEFGRYFTAPGAIGQPCPDSGVAYLRDDTGTLIDIGCTGVKDAPRVWVNAFDSARRLMSELDGEAEPAWTSSSLLVIRDARTESDDDLEWTAALDLETVAIDYPQSAPPLQVGFAMDPGTLEVVNGLRQQVLASEGNPFTVFVRDREGRRYQLYVRDEPPAHVAAALEDVLATEY